MDFETKYTGVNKKHNLNIDRTLQQEYEAL